MRYLDRLERSSLKQVRVQGDLRAIPFRFRRSLPVPHISIIHSISPSLPTLFKLMFSLVEPPDISRSSPVPFSPPPSPPCLSLPPSHPSPPKHTSSPVPGVDPDPHLPTAQRRAPLRLELHQLAPVLLSPPPPFLPGRRSAPFLLPHRHPLPHARSLRRLPRRPSILRRHHKERHHHSLYYYYYHHHHHHHHHQ